MKSIFTKISNLLKLPTIPNTQVPPPLILSGVPRRSGLRPAVIAEKIIARKSEAGLPIGALDDGSPNPDEVMIRIIVEEIIRAFANEAVIEVAIRPGDTATGVGGNAGGPVTVVSSITTIGQGYGIIK